MIYAITSRKSGCGRTTIALLTAMLTASKVNGSTILLDLSYGNDIYSVLKANKPNASIDNLISAVGLDPSYIDFDENLIDVNGMFFIPGTSVNQSRYLEKRYLNVKDLLDVVHSKFNSVIIDVDYSLYEELVDLGLEITPIHVLDQNMLNIEKYHSDIQTGIFTGFYVLNKYREEVFPNFEFFDRNFKQGSLVVVDLDVELTSILNRKNLTLKSIEKSKCFEGLDVLSNLISQNVTVTNSIYTSHSASRKFSIFDMFLGGNPRRKASNKNKTSDTKSSTKDKSNNSVEGKKKSSKLTDKIQKKKLGGGK